MSISGLPAEIPAGVVITAPGGAKLTANASRTFDDLEPGSYQITAPSAASERSTFAPVSVPSVVEVVAGDTPAQVSLSYTLITGVASVTVSGLPAGFASNVTMVSGPRVITRTITGSGEIGNLSPGAYSITAAAVDAGEIYGGFVSPSSILVTPSTTAVPVSVVYTTITGSIRLTATGLPAGVTATWDITGPDNFSRTVSGTGEAEVVIAKLQPGQYRVTGRSVISAGENYGPASGPVTITVLAGQSISSATSFIIRPPTLNLGIVAAYLVQSSQTLDGNVPLVASRDAYLRVFVQANEPNNAIPDVRVRLYRDGGVIFTRTIKPPQPSVPTVTNQATNLDAWSMTISGSLVQPGTSLLVDVDPDNAVKETSDADNQFPVNGSPRALDVRTVSPVNLRFVPISTFDGFVGNMTAARLSEMVSLTQRMYPLLEITADMRAIYSTGLHLAKSDSNNAWSKILAEIEALRVSEGSGRQYVGVLKDNATGSGIAGIGYRPGRSVLSLDENYASEIVVHELGHNWNRPHSPCGGPNGVDPSYPYPEGNIGVYGLDLLSGLIQTPDVPDVMSYCRVNINFNLNVPRRWASDYTYTSVMNYRSVFGDAPVNNAVRQECLIVWGRVTSGKLILEPSFVSTTIPSLPSRRGGLSINGRDASGNILYSVSFDPTLVEDLPASEGHFAFAIPLNSIQVDRISRLELSGRGLNPSVQQVRSADPPLPISATSSRPGFTRLQWNAARNPLIVVRDPVTREILSIATSGNALVRTSGRAFEVIASNGVRSAHAVVRE